MRANEASPEDLDEVDFATQGGVWVNKVSLMGEFDLREDNEPFGRSPQIARKS